MSSCKVLKNFHVWMSEKLEDTIFVHLDGRDKLLLCNVYVSDVQPDIRKFGSCFADLA